ncbi:methyltransferase domain-containing protein [Candidatus Micrarchaeota archaeon]|nr:methyltransferase domain-containing protein [Candidatus Micrarchaeota archaeon]
MIKIDFHFPPLVKKLKRGGPAVTQPKDAGLVFGYTGIGKDSKVLELGSGSGFMTVQMANIVRSVKTYDKREEFSKLAQENVEKAGMTNVEFVLQDVLEKLDEPDNEYDLVFCDIAEPEKIIEKLYKTVKKDGFLVGHCLQSEQTKTLQLAAQKCFTEVFVLEGVTREYEAKQFGFRPKHFGLTYTAYLVFARK